MLSGYSDLTLVDMDTVAPSNLNRCVMFTPEDAEKGAPKVEALARAAMRSMPFANARIRTVPSRVQELDDAFFKGFDMALGCLDNVEARLHVNSHCMKAGIPLIDGGTDGMRGKVQVVLPTDGPCIECTMNRSHMRVLEERYSCSGRDVTFFTPRLAAEITTTSIVAAMQVREALKVTHGLREAVARGIIYYDGMGNGCEVLDVERSPNCPNHGTIVAVSATGGREGGTTSVR